jgi:hypothetical protein
MQYKYYKKPGAAKYATPGFFLDRGGVKTHPTFLFMIYRGSTAAAL